MGWAAVARQQHGVLTRPQLLASGLTSEGVRRLTDEGALVPVVQGVYLARGAPRTQEASLWIAVLATGGALGFGTACQLWGMIDDAPSRTTVLIPEPRHVATPPGVRVRLRTRAFPIDLVRGLPVTTRASSLLDHLSEVRGLSAGSLLDRGIQRGWLSVEDVRDRLRSPMWGNTRLRILTQSLDAEAASEFERRFHRALRQADLSDWSANLLVRLPHGEVLIDVAFAEQQLAIELDGMAFHADAAAVQRDRRRQNALVAAGWRVLRFTWHDLEHRPRYVIAAIRAELVRTR